MQFFGSGTEIDVSGVTVLVLLSRVVNFIYIKYLPKMKSLQIRVAKCLIHNKVGPQMSLKSKMRSQLWLTKKYAQLFTEDKCRFSLINRHLYISIRKCSFPNFWHYSQSLGGSGSSIKTFPAESMEIWIYQQTYI